MHVATTLETAEVGVQAGRLERIDKVLDAAQRLAMAGGKVPVAPPIEDALRFVKRFYFVKQTSNAKHGNLHDALKGLVPDDVRNAFLDLNLAVQTKEDIKDAIAELRTMGGTGTADMADEAVQKLERVGSDVVDDVGDADDNIDVDNIGQDEGPNTNNKDDGDDDNNHDNDENETLISGNDNTAEALLREGAKDRQLAEDLFTTRVVAEGTMRDAPTLDEALAMWGIELKDLEWDKAKKQLVLKLHEDWDWGFTVAQLIDSAAMVRSGDFSWKGAILGNACGTGKTLTLGAAIWLNAQVKQRRGDKDFTPFVIVCPPAVLTQNAAELIERMTGFLDVGVFYAARETIGGKMKEHRSRVLKNDLNRKATSKGGIKEWIRKANRAKAQESVSFLPLTSPFHAIASKPGVYLNDVGTNGLSFYSTLLIPGRRRHEWPFLL